MYFQIDALNLVLRRYKLMNILILTGRFGMGHYSVAEALQEEINLENKNTNIEIIDIIDYMFPKTNKHIYESFNFIVSKYSSVYNMYCGFSDKKFNMPMKRFISKKISKLIEDKSIDLILSTLPFSSQVVSVYKEITGSRIPLYTYITDISSHEEWIAPYTDFYFVGAKESKKNLALKGVNPNIVIVSGIPVKKCFRSEEIIKEKDKDKFEILIMGGGLGLLPCADNLLKNLSQNSDVHVTVITGKNDMLKEEIEEKYPSIEVVGYTNEVHYYMKRSDLLITKSGGITTFEAINSQTPLFIIKPFLKQEIGNAQFIDRENLGLVIWYDDTDIVKDILIFIENRNFIKMIKENMNKIKNQWSNICPLYLYYMEGEATC